MNKGAIRETEETRHTHTHTTAWAPNHLNWVQIKNCSSVWQPSNCHAGSVKAGWLSSFWTNNILPSDEPNPHPSSPRRQSVIGAVMSDDVNYVSDYFYTEKQGQIGSLPGLSLQTGLAGKMVWFESGADRWASEAVITRGWEMIAVEIASAINQTMVDMLHRWQWPWCIGNTLRLNTADTTVSDDRQHFSHSYKYNSGS